MRIVSFERVFPTYRLCLLAGVMGLVACDGMSSLVQGTGSKSSASSVAMTPEIIKAQASLEATPALRRLTRAEYDAAVKDLLGDVGIYASSRLPEDLKSVDNPFDNDQKAQAEQESGLAESNSTLATDIVRAFIAQSGKVNQLAGCTGTSGSDAACLTQLVTRVGKRALRRPLAAEEVASLVDLGKLAGNGGTFNDAAGAVLRALLTNPEFIFRVEAGIPVNGSADMRQLSAVELASKLSFTLLGAPPPDSLLEKAEAGLLDSPEAIAAAAHELLKDPRAQAQMLRFHSLWLGYSGLSSSAQAFRDETNALLADIITSGADHFTLFTSARTFVNAELAGHYGLPAPSNTSGGWVNYPDPDKRAGIFAQASFLSAQPSGGEASTTRRGRQIITRFLCRILNPPPPSVKPVPVPPGMCHKEYMREIHAAGSCADCHSKMDPVGEGLEQYDLDGTMLATEPGNANCALSGEGSIPQLGAFNGPKELGAMIAGSPEAEVCLSRHVWRFAQGRVESLTEIPKAEETATQFKASGRKLPELWVAVVSDPMFRLRKELP